jgi:hypothetical protein
MYAAAHQPSITTIGKWQISIKKEPCGLILSSMDPMEQAALLIKEPEISDSSHGDADIESLAREACVSRELVAKIYSREHAKLAGAAKIKTYVPVLTRRRVKTLLREHRGV